MAEIPFEHMPEAQGVGPQGVVNFPLEGRADSTGGAGTRFHCKRARRAERILRAAHDGSRCGFGSDALAEHLASKDGPGNRRPLQEALRPADPEAMPGAMLPLRKRSRREFEEMPAPVVHDLLVHLRSSNRTTSQRSRPKKTRRTD